MGQERGHEDVTSTSIEGLDDVPPGGLHRGGFYLTHGLAQGEPGSGKTTVALQFLHGRGAETQNSVS